MDTVDSAGRIVVGTDTSDAARIAVDWAAARASERAKPLLILVAVAPSPDRAAPLDAGAPAESPFLSRVKEAAEEAAAAELARVRAAHPGLDVQTAVVVDVPSRPLAAATADADLVVVGARGYSAPLKTAALGGTSDAVATHAHGPVAVVPEFSRDNPQHPDGPVVVGVDDSEQSLAAIAWAAGEAGRRGVPLVAVHAWRAWPWLTDSLVGWSVQDASLGVGLEQMVKDLCAPYLADGQELVTRVEIGHPAVKLVEASDEASLVVIGSRGRGGVLGLLLGSTSREVMRQARCPVVVVRT